MYTDKFGCLLCNNKTLNHYLSKEKTTIFGKYLDFPILYSFGCDPVKILATIFVTYFLYLKRGFKHIYICEEGWHSICSHFGLVPLRQSPVVELVEQACVYCREFLHAEVNLVKPFPVSVQ